VDTSGGSDEQLSSSYDNSNVYHGAAINRIVMPNGDLREICSSRQPPDGCAVTECCSTSTEPPPLYKILSEQIACHRRLFDLSTKTLEMSQSRVYNIICRPTQHLSYISIL